MKKADPFHVLKVCVEASFLGVNIHDSASFWRNNSRYIAENISRFKEYLAEDLKINGLFSVGPEQDSTLFATVLIPGPAGEYFSESFIPYEHPSRNCPSWDSRRALAENIFGLEFSGLGPVVTCRRDEFLPSDIRKCVIDGLATWGFYYVPFSQASQAIDSPLNEMHNYPATWYSAAFSYT